MIRPTLIILGIAIASLPAMAAPTASQLGTSKNTVQIQTALSGNGVAFRETNLGNLIADAVRQTGHAQVALVPADEIDGGAQIAAGKSEIGTIVSTLVYESDPSDTVVILNLTGAQLRKVAERSVSRAPQPFDGFLQVSGLNIRYTLSAAEGKRVTGVSVGGSEVSAGQTYRVAVTRPLAGGSLGYFQILSQKDIAEDTGVPISKSLDNYLTAHPIVNSVIEDRITAH